MPKLDLRPEKVAAWHAKLPEDIRAAIDDEKVNVPEDRMAAMVSDLASAAARRIPEILHKNGDMLAEAGRARRVIILAWAINRAAPDAAAMVREIANDGDGDESGEGGGRKKVAPYFRADLEAMGRVATSRIVRAAADNRTIGAVSAGIKEFELSAEMQRPGGL